ncbi:hypothetical protein H2203_008410 [Taxawa tesnikishii (nom. ined.)]|nr:hypothetical protein H2203_008410 [Dothideales sp. JES 119]
MKSFILSTLIAPLAFQVAQVVASPLSFNHDVISLESRQDSKLPCSQYCSVSAGCMNICRPANCDATYLIESDDTCDSIVNKFGNFTAKDLLDWNPEIGQSCLGLQAYVPACIGVPGFFYPGPITSGYYENATAIPVPIMPQIVKNCTRFEYIGDDSLPTLATILEQNHISKTQFNTWNFPGQDATQDWAPWRGYFSCVAA